MCSSVLDFDMATDYTLLLDAHLTNRKLEKLQGSKVRGDHNRSNQYAGMDHDHHGGAAM